MQDNYSTNELIFNDKFRKWVLNGSAADGIFWENLAQRDVNSKRNIQEAREFILKMHRMHESISEAEVRTELEKLSGSIKTEATPQPIPLRNIWRYVAAAFIAVGLFGTMYTAYRSFFKETSIYEAGKTTFGNQLVEFINDKDMAQQITLSDGSIVRLSPLSKLSYPKTFASNQRKVYLIGEGYFEVAKNAQKPFLVYTNALVTKVLGTSFTVRAMDNVDKIEVVVRTGKVAVAPLKPSELTVPKAAAPEVVLTANQQVVFDRKEDVISKSIVEIPLLLKDTDGLFVRLSFNNTPVTQAFDTFSKAYGIPIIYDKQILRDCEVSAEFNGESFFQQLNLICKAIEANYTTSEGSIIIKTSGCKPY